MEIPDGRRGARVARVADGVVYFGSWDSYFYAVDAATGAQKWRFHGGEDPLIHNQVGFQSSPAVVDGVVYTGCRDSNLYAIDAATGSEKWRFDDAGSWVVSSPAVTNGKVIFGTSDSSLYLVLDAETGKPIVRKQGKAFCSRRRRSRATRSYVGVLNGTLEARDLTSGDLLWEFQTDASKRNNGWVLTAERKFNGPMLFRPTGARRRWSRPIGRPVSVRSSRRRSSSEASCTSAARTATLYALE